MSGMMKLPSFQQFSTLAHDWSTEVVLQAKGNTYTVCLFTEPDPALRERFDGTAECTQEGHSLYGKKLPMQKPRKVLIACEKSTEMVR
jgi:hypothetical protein